MELTGRYGGIFETLNFTGMNFTDKFYTLTTVAQSSMLVGMIDFSSSMARSGIES